MLNYERSCWMVSPKRRQNSAWRAFSIDHSAGAAFTSVPAAELLGRGLFKRNVGRGRSRRIFSKKDLRSQL
jgi:hypothetical protein